MAQTNHPSVPARPSQPPRPVTAGLASGVFRPRVVPDLSPTRRASTRRARSSARSCPQGRFLDRERAGWPSTSGCSSSPRTRHCRCWSARTSWRSSPATSTSSSWSASPASSAASPPASPPASASGLQPRDVLDLILTRSPRAHGPARRLLPERRRAAAGRRGHPRHPLGRADRRGAGAARQAVPAADLPGADAAGRRPRAPVPVHLRAVAEPRRRGAQPRRPATSTSPGSRCRRCCRRFVEAGHAALRAARGRDRARTWTSCSPAWRCSTTTCSGSPATRTSRSRRTTPRTCSRRWRRSCCGAASARRCGSRSRSRSTPRCWTCSCRARR